MGIAVCYTYFGMNTAQIQSCIAPLLRKYSVSRADLFGSRVRGDQTGESDVDLLVQLPHEASLFDFIGLKLDLEDVLGCSVDLVEYDAIKPRLKSYILRDTLSIPL